MLPLTLAGGAAGGCSLSEAVLECTVVLYCNFG